MRRAVGGHVKPICGRPAMNYNEHALTFDAAGNRLCGVLSLPEQPGARAVLIMVGGPQYRVGSHRQFTLLARYLAAHAIPVLRFDYRGMGDSEGNPSTFEDVAQDIRAALDTFFTRVPVLQEVVIWGLCDAASATLFYAYQDPRVSGVVLLNPWVRTEQGLAKAYLKHYYLARLFDAELWRKVRHGEFNYGAALKSFAALISTALTPSRHQHDTVATPAGTDMACKPPANSAALPDRMADGLRRFKGKVLLILSGNDMTADEFKDMAQSSTAWRKLLQAPRVTRRDLAQANHTFSRREWRDQVATWTKDWLNSW